MFITKNLWVVLVVIVFLRILLFFLHNNDYSNGTKIRVSGKVSVESYKYQYSQSVFINGFYTYLPLYPEIDYGDQITVEGIVEDNKLLNAELISLTESDNVLVIFRESLLDMYQRALPQDHAALVAGMTIGSKQSITQEFREKLKNTGTAHVVVASGMNIALVAGFMINLLVGFFERKKALIIAFVAIWIYAFIAGFEAPIIRAAIMASLTFSAQKIGKVNYAWRTLFITVFVMLMLKPEWIIDLGFLLSVAATTSLMFFEDKVRKKLVIVPRFIREDLSTTLAAQILVAPLLILFFGRFNILSPITNALVLWTVPLVTTMGMLAGVVGLFYFPLGQLILYLIYPLTWWFVAIVELFGS